MEERKKKKGLIIIITTIIILLLVTLTVFFLTRKKNDDELPDWGKKYYNYLKNFQTESKPLLSENNIEMVDQYQGNLYYYSDNEEDPPLLSLDPEPIDENNNYLIVVLLIDGKPRDFVIKKENAEIELLYNIEKEEYYYYLIYQENNQTHFIKLADYIDYLLDNSKQYEEIVVTNGEKINVNGEEILKIDTLFIEPNQPEIQFDYKPEEIKGLEDDFKYYIKDVKNTEKLLKDDNKNGIGEKKEKIKSIIIEIEKQKNEPIPEPDPEPIPEPTPEPPSEPGDPSITDPNNCTGWNKEYAANPCLCETFTGCINDLFEHEVCGIGYCSSKMPMTQEECASYGGELSGDTCWTPYK